MTKHKTHGTAWRWETFARGRHSESKSACERPRCLEVLKDDSDLDMKYWQQSESHSRDGNSGSKNQTEVRPVMEGSQGERSHWRGFITGDGRDKTPWNLKQANRLAKRRSQKDPKWQSESKQSGPVSSCQAQLALQESPKRAAVQISLEVLSSSGKSNSTIKQLHQLHICTRHWWSLHLLLVFTCNPKSEGWLQFYRPTTVSNTAMFLC